MQLTRTHVLALAAALAAGGCASAGGFPEAGDASAAIPRAEVLIQEAERAGADSLAGEALTSARQNLAAARSARDGRDNSRAALRARQAQADATYAKEAADRARAERDRTAAEAAMRQLTPGGAR